MVSQEVFVGSVTFTAFDVEKPPDEASTFSGFGMRCSIPAKAGAVARANAASRAVALFFIRSSVFRRFKFAIWGKSTKKSSKFKGQSSEGFVVLGDLCNFAVQTT